MFLKKVELQGFKSFPEKINIQFNSGITAIVGPNGSGKSNIADAIRWVLGEQSMKNLRGSKLEDIIFTGTENRKPLGFAEVSLTIDNSKGILPIEFSEVTITRRVYRSGESEFFINKTPCRLKDIAELVMGTGIGKEGYSIIGQGKVDEILSTKPEDRRSIFEEATGIMKYKIRKIEAEKKLEQTRQNLLRINDIICELEKQLEPLKEQSQIAKRYLDLREKLKILEVNLFIDTINKNTEKLAQIKNFLEDNLKEIEKEQKNYAQSQNEKKFLQAKLIELETELEQLQRSIFEVTNLIEHINSEIMVTKEKIENNSANYKKLDLEIKEFEEKRSNLENELEQKLEKYKQLQENQILLKSELIDKEQQLAVISSDIDAEQIQLETIKSEIIEKMRLISEKKSELSNLNTLTRSIHTRFEQINSELSQLTLEENAERLKKLNIENNLKKIKEEIACINKEITGLDKLKNKMKSEMLNLDRELNELKTELHKKESRLNFLCDLEKEREGYSKSVKDILEECATNSEFHKGIHGPLAQLISVPKEFEIAIEMALGFSLQNIVTDDEEAAQKAINFLKQKNSGRATFLPINRVNGKEIDENSDKIYLNEGFIGVASKLISFDKKYQGIINNLLGKTVIVDNLDNGINLARRYNYSFRIVTLSGDIINPSGAITGGSITVKTNGILSRKREISELISEIKQLKEEFMKKKHQFEEIVKESNAVNNKIGQLGEIIRAKQLIAAKEEEKLESTNNILNKIQERIYLLNLETEQLKIQEEEMKSSSQKIEEIIRTSESEVNSLQNSIQGFEEKFKQKDSERKKVYDELTNIKILLSSSNEGINSIEEVINMIKNEINVCDKNINRRHQEKQRINNDNSNLEALISELDLKTTEAMNQRIKIENELNAKKRYKEEMNKKFEEIENQLSETLKRIELLKEENSRLEFKKSRIEMDMDFIQNRMWEEYEITLNKAQEYKKEIKNLHNIHKEINKIKDEIKALGAVNVGAIDEYIKIKERYDFLIAQKNDLEASESKLRKIISDITSSMKKQFIEQFNHICDNFNQVFQELFGGGKAILKLAEEDNILESGIDIEVQLPGKRLQNMLLLSGGEKSLTAIALLFAILKMNPSPFCVLDEIDAALDEVNIYRFVEYLKKFTNNTQFIIITHRRITMEAAETLYGVTMEEKGVSKIVSLRIAS